jgi:OOP family OmpA-OmpF porin
MTYRGKNYDVLDSAYYPKFRSKQFRNYMAHQEAFPPKPRSYWEAGFGLGLYNVIGDVPTLMLWNKGGGGLNLHVRKSLGYIFSLRAQYIYGVGKNLDRQPTSGYDEPYTGLGYTPVYAVTSPGQQATQIYRSTRTEASQLSLDMIFNAHNIRFHTAKTVVSLYGYLGIGALGYKTRVNALNGTYQPYNFLGPGGLITDPNASKKSVRKDLQSKMDKTYETAAESSGGSTILDNKTLDFAPSIGAGAQFRINKQFNVQVEERYTFPSDGFIDGTRFGRNLGTAPGTGRSSDAINYFSVSLNYNFNPLGKKAVEPLYWINPLDHAYNELSYPRHMILPNPVLPDADGDGVTDQFDKCPKTPAGVAVDAHGCPMDTDGDGVPDYKDKQLITPTECQPVDADGVGHCPCPDDCQGKIAPPKDRCGTIGVGSVAFPEGVNKVTPAMMGTLATLAAQMQANPDCKVVILGGGSGSKAKLQHSWEHVNAVIEHMSEKHSISRDRFIFKYGEAGDESIVTYRPANADESGSSNVPPPHPNIH